MSLTTQPVAPRRQSLTVRLTLLFALVSTAVLLGLGYLIGISVEQHFIEQDMDLLDGKLALTRNALQKVRAPAELAALPAQLEEALVGHQGLAIIVSTADGTLLFESGHAHFPAALLLQHEATHATTWDQDHHEYRGIAGLASTSITGSAPLTVGIATEISHHQHFMASFRQTLWWFVMGASVLTGLFGWIAIRRVLAPLRSIRRKAATITASNLHNRLSLDQIPAELVELSETLNDMLARLEESFRRLSDFSSDLAHELRTPISNLMTQTQVSLSKARSVGEYQDILSSNAEELERMSRMVSDMLLLAKADNGLIMTQAETVALAGEVASLFDFYEALAEASSIKLLSEGDAHITADRLMLRRALSNLLSNALRHATPGTTVRATINTQDDYVSLTLENQGPTIAAEHLPRLFDRFYRIDPSRQRSSDGAGLGLAITQTIIHAHGGKISAHSDNNGTRFTIELPALEH